MTQFWLQTMDGCVSDATPKFSNSYIKKVLKKYNISIKRPRKMEIVSFNCSHFSLYI